MASSLVNQGKVSLEIPTLLLKTSNSTSSTTSKSLNRESPNLKSPNKVFSKCCICDLPIPYKLKSERDQSSETAEEWKIDVFRILCHQLNVPEILNENYGMSLAEAFPLCVVCAETASKMASINRQAEALLKEMDSLTQLILNSISTTFNEEGDQLLESGTWSTNENEPIQLFRNLVVQKGATNNEEGSQEYTDFARIEAVNSVSQKYSMEKALDNPDEDLRIKCEDISPCVSPSPDYSPLSLHEEDYVWPLINHNNNTAVKKETAQTPEKIARKRGRPKKLQRKEHRKTKSLPKTKLAHKTRSSTLTKTCDDSVTIPKKLPNVDREGYIAMLKMGIPFKRVEILVERSQKNKKDNSKLGGRRERRKLKATQKVSDINTLADLDEVVVNDELDADEPTDPDYCPDPVSSKSAVDKSSIHERAKRRKINRSKSFKKTIVEGKDSLKTGPIDNVESLPKRFKKNNPINSSCKKVPYNKTANARQKIVFNELGIHTCGICGDLKQTENGLLLHIKKFHPSSISPDKEHVNNVSTPSIKKKFEVARTIISNDGRMFYRKFEILKTEDGRHKCSQCSKLYKSMEGVRDHIRQAHTNLARPKREWPPKKSNLKIITGENGVSSYGGVEFKELENGQFLCRSKMCIPRVYKTQSSMLRHIYGTHLGLIKRAKYVSTTSKTIVKTVKTPDGRKFYRGTELLVTPEGKHQCGTCNRVLASISCLLSHIVWRHENSEGCFKCKYCPKTFCYEFILKSHELTHADTREFICEKCGRSFKHKSSLGNHIRQYHEKLLKEECKKCGKRFFLKRDLLSHERSHLGEKPFRCIIDGCKRKFVTAYLQRVHAKKVHGTTSQTATGASNDPALLESPIKELPLLSRQDQLTNGDEDPLEYQLQESGPPKLVPFYANNTSSDDISSGSSKKIAASTSTFTFDQLITDSECVFNTGNDTAVSPVVQVPAEKVSDA